MVKLTGGEALVRSMETEGIDTVFGVPGNGQYEIVDSFWNKKEIRYISLRHEQASTYMADGFFRASNKIAGVVVVEGPGFFNATGGLATAYDASSPMLIITGTSLYGHDSGKTNIDWVKAMTKWATIVDRPAQMPETVHEAIRQMKTGRPRPVLIQVSQSVLASKEEVKFIDPVDNLPSYPDKDQIKKLAKIIAGSQSPLIWAGGGVNISNANESILNLSEFIQAPVVTTANGKGVISDRHPLSLGFSELRYEPLAEMINHRDLILAVGTRTNFSQIDGTKVVRLDVDPIEINRHNHHDIGLHGDAKTTIDSLMEVLPDFMERRDSVEHRRIAELQRERFSKENQLEPQGGLMHALRESLPDEGIVVQGMNQMGYYSRNYMPIYSHHGYMSASHFGTLGHAFPVGLGAKLAKPERPVVVISGDGGFLYNSQEISTAIKYGINLVVVVFNDNAYGNVLRAQKDDYSGHVIGTKLSNPDFVQLGKSYGMRTYRTDNKEQLKKILEESYSEELPTLIEVPVGEMERVY